MPSSGFVFVCTLLCSVVLGPRSSGASPMAMYYKKSSIDCVDADGNCFNTDECCGGFTCAADDSEDDSATTPGRCIRAKNLTPCTTSADCIEVDESCSSLNDVQGQSYCLPTPSDNANDLQELLEVNAPGKHQAYSKQLSEYGGSCMTSADCQQFTLLHGSTKIRLCCQQVTRGRQGNRRICDRITPISICIPPPSM